MSLQDTKRELEVLIRARYPIIVCESYEEQRVEKIIAEISARRGVESLVWSQSKGFVDAEHKSIDKSTAPDKALRFIAERKTDCSFVLKDFHPYLKDPSIIRLLRDLGQSLKLTKKNLIFVSPQLTIPTELSKEVAVVSIPLPGREDIESILRETPGVALEECSHPAVEAALGLTHDEIENIFAKSLVKFGRIAVDEILTEKRQIVQKAGILEFVPIHSAFDEIGGLGNLKEWLRKRKQGFSQAARAINLPAPKGILLVGLPGCGKSLTAACTGAAWQMPLLRLDMGKVFSGLVGSSEANMRLALQTAESVAPCILWIDEIEKGLGGGSGGDGGTSVRVFGSFLTWMQEKSSPVFVLATANDISALPPEMLRKGRFDEIFFVDTPTAAERAEILAIHMKKRAWVIDDVDHELFLDLTDQFTGAEIEQALIDAAYDAFFLEQPISMEIFSKALKRTVPLSKTMKEKIQAVRSWAQDRAVPASPAPISQAEFQKIRILEV